MGNRVDEMLYMQEMQDLIAQSEQSLSRRADKLMRTFTDAVMKNTLPETWQIHRAMLSQTEALVNQLGILQSEEKQRIYYFASIKTIMELGDVLCIAMEENDELQRYRQFKYIYPVLGILVKSGSMPLCRIADELNISRNALSNFFKRTDAFYLWNMKQYGREHYYTITAKGKKAYKNYHLQEQIVNKKETYETVMINVLDLLAKEMRKGRPDFSNILHSMNKKERRGIAVFSSEAVAAKLKEMNISYELGEEYRRQKRQQEHERKMHRGIDTSMMLENDSEFIMQNVKAVVEA